MMEQYLKRTWAEVDLDAIAYNYGLIKNMAGNAECMCIVKADAYGHGAVPVARQLFDCGARYFAVSNIEEAMQLRDGGISAAILILGYTPPDLANMLYISDITQTVFSVSGARKLAACSKGRKIKVHVKIDTGMSRLGLMGTTAEIADQVSEICSLPELQAEGIFTHFARADEKEESITAAQFEKFSEVIRLIGERGINIKYRHCCNSAGMLAYGQYCMNMVRPGLILYGISPFGGDFGKPAMSLKTVISQTKHIPQGTPVSYGGKYITPAESEIAVLSVGYADGMSRLLSGKAQVLVKGKRVNTVGNICMDMTMADITGMDIHEGDTAVIIGSDVDDRITADDIAKLIGTIPYEVISLVGKRVARVYLKNNEVVARKGLLEH